MIVESKELFPSKRQYLANAWHNLLFQLGFYDKYGSVEWNEVRRVVFVCKGNVCRSPYAEAVASRKGLATASSGITVEQCVPADTTAKKVSKDRGIELGKHISKSVNKMEFCDSDLLVAMEPWQARALERVRLSTGAQITLLGLWMSYPKPYVFDPMGAGPEFFHACYDAIDRSIDGIVRKYISSRQN